MILKLKQTLRDEKRTSLQKSQSRISFPSINLKHGQKSSSISSQKNAISLRYNSQKKLIHFSNNNKNEIPIKPAIKFVKQATKSNQNQVLISLNSYKSAQNIHQTINPTQRDAKSKQIYDSPKLKPNRLNKLSDLLLNDHFLKKHQSSVDTQRDDDNEDQKYAKKMFTPKKVVAYPENELWLVKKQKLSSNARDHLSSIIQKKLEAQKSHTTLANQPNTKFHLLNHPPRLIYEQKNTILSNSSSPLKPTSLQSIQETKLVGQEAVQQYYEHYKKMDQIKQLQDLRNQVNPLTIILTILQNYNIPPKRMDIIKFKGAQSILDLKQIGLGHSVSIKAISDILEKLKFFRTINLSYNSISFDRVDIIIPQLKGIRNIDLSHNRIGKQGVDLLATEICIRHKEGNDNNDDSSSSDSDSEGCNLLENLNLEENGLSDQSMNTFLISLKAFRHLKILNLSKNFLGNNFALRLKQFLIDQNHLDQLYLNWNDITSKGMKNIFEGLSINKNLKVLDLSWNELGFEAITAVNNFFKKNNTLLHLNLSNCNITVKDTHELSEGIKCNNTIIGLHFQGNKGFVDSIGFLHPLNQNTDKVKDSLRSQLLERIRGVRRVTFSSDKYDFSQEKILKTCWICNGWQEKTIKVKKIRQIDQACFIHFDFEDFIGVAMDEVEQNFQLVKMLPPRIVKFFITKVNRSKKIIHQTAIQYKGLNNFETQTLSAPLKLGQFLIQKKQFNNIELKELNILDDFDPQFDDLFDDEYIYQFTCRPRTKNVVPDRNLFIEPSPLKKPKVRREKKQRNKENDKKARQLPTIELYFNTKDEDQKYKSSHFAHQCTEFDIDNSKIKKIVSSESEVRAIKQILAQHYSSFLNIYRHLSNSCVNSITSIFHISQTKFEHFLDFMQFQTKNLSRAKIRLKLVATLSINDEFTKIQNKNPEIEQRLFSRPQLFQFLLRMAIVKYCKSNKSKDEEVEHSLSPSEAFQRVMISLQRFSSKLTLPSVWRQNYLHTYDISLVLKSYEHFLETVYSSYAGSYQKNVSSRFQKKMILNEFKQIFLDVDFKKSRQALKDAELAFIQSKQPQIDQGTRQYGLNYNEFLQAIIRMAHSNNLKPIGTEENKLWQKIGDMQLYSHIKNGREADLQVPLFLKFQALLKKIYQQNRHIHHSRKMNTVFEKGLFYDEVQMLMQILKQRFDKYQEKHRPITFQTTKKIKVNTMDHEQQKAIQAHQQDRMHHRITLQYLIEELKEKFKKMSEQLDKDHLKEVEEQVAQEDNNNQDHDEIV